MPTLCKSPLSALAVLVLIVVLTEIGASAPAARNERLGNSWEFELQGNPSTGYHWELNAAASSNLDVVKVEIPRLRERKRQTWHGRRPCSLRLPLHLRQGRHGPARLRLHRPDRPAFAGVARSFGAVRMIGDLTLKHSRASIHVDRD